MKPWLYWTTALLIILASYLWGSIQCGLLLSRLFGKGADIRDAGSRSTGATNVARVVGVLPGALTFLLDVLKGFVPPFLVSRYLPGQASLLLAVLSGLAIALGHSWPIFFKFRGGKGVASSLGVLFACFPVLGGVALAVFLAVAFSTKYVSVGSMSAAFSTIIASLVLGMGREALIYTAAGTALIIFQHRSNIARLARGEENRVRLGSRSRR